MAQLRLNCFWGFFSYGGNGGFRSEHPDIRDWFARTLLKARADERVGEIEWKDIADTPIPMSRNAMVLEARKSKADVLIMVDSDQSPDCLLLKDKDALPFWDSSFDYLYKHWHEKALMIGSPYCGPPDYLENVYVFKWRGKLTGNANDDYSLEAYTREEASQMSGIHECGALPTGLIMTDMRLYDYTDPKRTFERLVAEGMDPDLAAFKAKPWHYYEWQDIYQASKGSTEDVTATRDISLAVMLEKGYNPLRCNWSAWAGHWKPKMVMKPSFFTVNHIGEKMKTAMLANKDSRFKMRDVSFSSDLLKRNGHVAKEQSGTPCEAAPGVRSLEGAHP